MRGTRVTGDDVVSCAVALLESEGFAALSVRRLGELLGVSRQVVYTHFGGMDGLWGALHRRGYERLQDRLEQTDEPPGSAAHVLAISRAYVDSARRSPRLFELALGRPVPDYQPTAETIAASRRSFAPVVAAAEAWLETGSGRTGATSPDRSDEAEALTLARALWATTHGHVTLELAGFVEPAETDRLVDRAVSAVLKGWGERQD